MVAENRMLRSGAEIHLTTTKKIRRMKSNINNIGNKEFAGISRSIRQNTYVLPVVIIILSIVFVILILGVIGLQTMWNMITSIFNILSRDDI